MAFADDFVDELMAVGIAWAPATLLADAISAVAFEEYLMSLPESDAGLTTGQPFWNGAFLCRKV